MLRLFRSISRGRRKDDESNPGAWSSFANSPVRPRYRVIRHRDREPEHEDEANYGDRDDDRDDDEDEAEVSPRRQMTSSRGFFFRTNNHGYDEEGDEEMDNEGEEEGDNEDDEDAPLLPIFSTAHLDSLPMYNITHAIRQLIVDKCETTLSWDQLRSPQISQFLVKPIQGQIRADHFNRATLCALIANCLQFQKEGQSNPGNVGVSRTRALISELLAMRLLRDFSTRELIDSLSYDFDPLQGMSESHAPNISNNNNVALARSSGPDGQIRRAQGRVARVSTIEIAIRAEAKRFLAHPVVVQHLEAIWSGNIVFHSEADNLHRKHRRVDESPRNDRPNYGTSGNDYRGISANAMLASKIQTSGSTTKPVDQPPARRAVTLYNPREASLFKLSRLRVPRYRQVFSTLSFATMLVLFVAVLADRSLVITPLEVLFWFWSIGYMLDEVVGFTEQGFGLYIMSFWNAFDLGILFLFVVYYCLRLYGIVLADVGKHRIAGIAYDVLASTAILLFPRLFSVLDHYRYFSQLLIAFRLMAIDLIAILVLIVICCSGFFVALSLSFADTRDAGGVAYSLFQIVMGFTPAVWDRWESYNILGKVIMGGFLTICHFLIVTILITVLTNSFMAIVKNAEEEHQFLFAINTISMVKSDALFSYVAPSNIVGWAISPVRFLIPMRTYVKLNRSIIKVSHFPILLVIFLYERVIMGRSVYAPTELIERKRIHQKQPVAFTANKGAEMYSVNHRLREPSVISFSKDRALDEVFRRPFHGDTIRTTTKEMELGPHSLAVDKWMQAAENEGGASPPIEQPRSVVERLEHRRPKYKRGAASNRDRMTRPSRLFSSATRSVASDPDLLSLTRARRPHRIVEEYEEPEMSAGVLPQDTEADGDDEINEESDGNGTPAIGESAISIKERTPGDDSESEFFQTPIGHRYPVMQLSHAARTRLADSPELLRVSNPSERTLPPPRTTHNRQLSSGTILFAPQEKPVTSNNPAKPLPAAAVKKTGTDQRDTALTTTSIAPGPSGSRNPAKRPAQQPKPRPIVPMRQRTAPDLADMGGLAFLEPSRNQRRAPSFNARALDLASDLGDNKWGPSGGVDVGGISGMPASFSEQLMREREIQRRQEEDRRRSREEEKGMVNRIMLARMHTLEEGFREVLREIKDLSHNANNSSRRDSEVDSIGIPIRTKGIRSKTETATSSSLGQPPSGWQTPKTAIGRIGGNDKSKKASPRKIVHRNSKRGMENDRPSSSGDAIRPEASSGTPLLEASVENAQKHDPQAASPESVRSFVEDTAKETPGFEGEFGRPQTERPSTAFRDDDLIELERQRSDVN